MIRITTLLRTAALGLIMSATAQAAAPTIAQLQTQITALQAQVTALQNTVKNIQLQPGPRGPQGIPGQPDRKDQRVLPVQ
jgi:hypothetical protein